MGTADPEVDPEEHIPVQDTQAPAPNNEGRDNPPLYHPPAYQNDVAPDFGHVAADESPAESLGAGAMIGQPSAARRTLRESVGAVGGTDGGPGEAVLGGGAHCRGCGNTERDLFCADCLLRPRPETNSPTSGGEQCTACGEARRAHPCPCERVRLCDFCLLHSGPEAVCNSCHVPANYKKPSDTP